MLAHLFFISLILVTVALNTCAQVLLKCGSSHHLLNLYLLGGIVAYGLSTIVYVVVLGKFNLSVAYPVVIGLTVITTTIAGATLLHEKVTSVNWAGIGLTIAGIFAIAFGKVS